MELFLTMIAKKSFDVSFAKSHWKKILKLLQFARDAKNSPVEALRGACGVFLLCGYACRSKMGLR
jgi:hypothetical protein